MRFYLGSILLLIQTRASFGMEGILFALAGLLFLHVALSALVDLVEFWTRVADEIEKTGKLPGGGNGS